MRKKIVVWSSRRSWPQPLNIVIIPPKKRVKTPIKRTRNATQIYLMFLMLGTWLLWSRLYLLSLFIFMWSWPPRPLVFFLSYDILVAYQSINFLVRKLKKDNIFGHEVSGHEHEKGGNFNNFYEGIMTIFYQSRFINNRNSEIHRRTFTDPPPPNLILKNH